MFEVTLVTFLEGKCGHAAIDFVSDRMIFNINLYSGYKINMHII